jgi:hypothetical protein
LPGLQSRSSARGLLSAGQVAPRCFREFIDRNSDWLTVFQLAPYAADLNPQEGIAGQARDRQPRSP